MSIAIFCGPQSHNGKPGRSVVLKASDGREYRDRIDVGSGFQREQLLTRAAGQFEVPIEEMLVLDAEIVKEADREDKRAAAAPSGDEPQFSPISSATLASTCFTSDPIIDDVLEAGQPGFIGGGFKTCKSLIGIDMAISAATGLPFLNHDAFAVRKARKVLYLCGEGGYPVLKEYGQRIARSKGIELGDVTGLHWLNKVPLLADLRELDAFKAAVVDAEAELVFIDPLFLAMPSEEAGNILKQGKVLGLVNRLCLEVGVTPQFIHHTTRTATRAARSNGGEPAELGDLSFSGPSEFAGQWALLSRREPFNPEYPGRHRLWLNIGARSGFGGLSAVNIEEGRQGDAGGRVWEVNVFLPQDARSDVQERQEEAKQAKRQEKVEADQKRVLSAMAKIKEPDTGSVIRARAGLSGERFNMAIASLLDAGEILPAEVVKANRKKPYDGYKLAEG